MAEIKRETISTAHFEEEIVKTIKTVESLENINKHRVLSLLRDLHNRCLEYDEVGIPTDKVTEIQEMLKEKGYRKNDEIDEGSK